MQKAEIKPKVDYAFREKRPPGAAVERVRILEHIRGDKWKAEWINPNAGLIHFVEYAGVSRASLKGRSSLGFRFDF